MWTKRRVSRRSKRSERLREATWVNAAYADPGTVVPSIFDKTKHLHVRCWFKVSATHLLERVPRYLALLSAHGVEWEELRSSDPGIMLYEDDVQIVVAPHEPAIDVKERPGEAASKSSSRRW